MKKSPRKKINRPKTAKKKKPTKRASHLRSSKSGDFMERFRSGKSGEAMVQYFTNLRILNPAAQLTSSLNEPRREGGFVRLAHAREEFTAPVLTKGKSVTPPRKTSKAKRRKKS